MLIDTEAAPARRAPDPMGRAPTPCAQPSASGRRSTPAIRRAEALADIWAGLPEGVTRWRLAAALRAAARALDLTSPMLRLIEHYVDLTYDQDWAAGSEPVICRPLAEIAEHMGLGERQLRNIERALVERGLMAFRDSGNHARRGRRDRATGRLVYAYGPSLAPLGARATEIVALAATARAEIAENRRLRLAISALRRRLRADLAAAEAAGVGASALRAGLDAAPDPLPAAMGAQALRAVRDSLAALAAEALALLGGPCPPDTPALTGPATVGRDTVGRDTVGRDTVGRDAVGRDAVGRDAVDPLPSSGCSEIAGSPAISTPHMTDTSNNHAASGLGIAPETARMARSCHTAPAAPLAADDRAARTLIHHDHGVGAIPLAVALAAAGPEIATLARADRPGWPALIEAARTVAPMLGVEQPLWGETCGRLGRGGATLALIILERGATRVAGEGEPIRRPAAYLRELLARADRAELHLDRSIRALAARPCAGPVGAPSPAAAP